MSTERVCTFALTCTELAVATGSLAAHKVEQAKLIWGDDLTKEETRPLTFIELLKKYLIPICVVVGLFVLWRINRAIKKGVSRAARPR